MEMPFTEEQIALMDKYPSDELAAMFDCPERDVVRFRRAMGIQPFSKRKWLTPEIREMLGKHPDSEVAEAAGVCTNTILTTRHRLDIPAHKARQSDMNVNFVSIGAVVPEAMKDAMQLWVDRGTYDSLSDMTRVAIAKLLGVPYEAFLDSEDDLPPEPEDTDEDDGLVLVS